MGCKGYQGRHFRRYTVKDKFTLNFNRPAR